MARIPAKILQDLGAELDQDVAETKVSTEGGVKVVISARRERDPALRAWTLKTHGARCAACGFDFGEFYGSWGTGFAEVHHVVPLAQAAGPVTTTVDDLVVLCANCHSMVHRQRGRVLSVDELKARITPGAAAAWAERLGS